MLKEIIDLQQSAVSELIKQIKYKDEITFKAPTGSGKTYMMAGFMNSIITDNPNVIFLVSTLSKGNLAEQNYNKFLEYASKGDFPKLKPYLINTEISGEENLFIPVGENYNVYLLPRDLYKKDGRLMNGAMDNFLNTMTNATFLGGLYKKIYLIKDECHIKTSNLDFISDHYFTKIINFSATPNLKRGQTPDVGITEDAAIQAKLIKHIELVEDDYNVEDALTKFEKIKESYRNLLGINPCLIIQISNKVKADEELNNIVFPALSKHQDLKWMLIVDKSSDCNTNDVFKAKKLPVSKWKDYAKLNTSTIDVIIFKMVISEGWDIPRACMLCQIRDTESKQLDEQVIGRVRRNPRLLDFENLSKEAQDLATTAWVWGVIREGKGKSYAVKLFDDPIDITSNIKLKTTRLKTLTQKNDFDLEKFVDSQNNFAKYYDIFELYKKLNKSDDEIKKMCYEYADTIEKWFKYTYNLDEITKAYNSYTYDYSQSMEIVKDEQGNEVLASFPTSSFYIDNEHYSNISNWVWKKQNGKYKFSFDSDAEREWADILKDLSYTNIKKVLCGKDNPKKGVQDIEGNIQPDKINIEEKALWGKNFVANSDIKYEYYLDGRHFSYPDFIMVDTFNRIHIFEVKSVNPSNNISSQFDSERYKEKMKQLIDCYKVASKLTGHIFYLPVLKDETWHITRLLEGDVKSLTEEQFKNFVRSH